MSQTAFVWIVIVLALVGANLPFLSERVLGVFKLARFAAGKPLWLRFAEVLAMYILVGVAATLLERSLGPIYPQAWEFFATTFTLFITFAFPGFIWRYLRRRH